LVIWQKLTFEQEIFKLNDNNLIQEELNQELIENKKEQSFNPDKAEVKDNYESKPYYKNPYLIGFVICVFVLGVLWYYSVNGNEISDTSSTISSTVV